MASLSVSASQYSLYLSISGLQYPESSYEQFAFSVDGNTINSYSNGANFTGLACGTPFTCSGAAKRNGVWYTIDSGSTHFTDTCPYIPPPTYPSSPSWTATATANSITTYVTFGASTHHVNVYLPGATPQTQTLYSSGNVTHAGLAANTNHTLYIQAWDSSETYGSGSQSYVVKTAGARPTNFSGWGITVAPGQNCLIPAAKWNEFTAKINAFRVYKGLSNYGFTTAVLDGDVYYWMFNQLRNAIYDMNTSVPAVVAKDDDFYASYLNALSTALNSIV